MAESIEHINYVRQIANYVFLLLPFDARALVLVDLPDSNRRPERTIGNFIPDLYYKDTRRLIIGEAKTENDIDRKHSIEQYRSYIREASLFDEESHIIICTSIYSYARIKNMAKRIKAEQNSSVKLHILNDIGSVSIV
ncbi:MAG TPA: hypothetical protein PLK90_02920 [Clostridiales bacterium]|jgi:hypothetical protein|nr:hypothetical protein [Clostridiales bacterium]HQP69331.1 hypothetical protein [Clostridiales bacterium]